MRTRVLKIGNLSEGTNKYNVCTAGISYNDKLKASNKKRSII